MDELIATLKSKCENKYRWNIEDFEVVQGSLQSKYGCKINFVTCETCKKMIREFDVTANYIETHKSLKSLEERVDQLGETIEKLEKTVKDSIKKSECSGCTGETGTSLAHSKDETSWRTDPVFSVSAENKEDTVVECEFKGVYGGVGAERIRECNARMHNLHL